MTATAEPHAKSGNHPATERASGPGPTVEGGITRLNPADGLFLRAEHLEAIQSYARELALAVGIAGGTGVVYGYTIDVVNDTIEVKPGLAIDPVGRPLRSTGTAVVSLSDPPALADSDGFWVIEVIPASSVFGNENVYGNLCDDPCSGSAIQPWITEGVTVRLRADQIAGLGTKSAVDRRGYLASQYFERERERGGPWLVPASPGGAISPILERDWAEGTAAPAAAGVPIGALQQVNGEWVLDVWTARRDIGGAPASNVWQWRLAMRPWNVFLAQVLQFEDQLAAVAAAATHKVVEIPDDREKLIAQLGNGFEKMTVKPRWLTEVVHALQKAGPLTSISAGKGLRDLGFGELPPAGFLQVAQVKKNLRERLTVLFGDNVDLRFCHTRADYVAHALEQSQHLDRIPLDPSDYRPQVDILIPDVPADLPALQTANYGWVAFVRRREARCEEPNERKDAVQVYYLHAALDDTQDSIQKGELPDTARRVGELTYPADTWAYPGGEVVLEIPFNNELDLALIAITTSKDRVPLASLRAALFAAEFDHGRGAPPVWAGVPGEEMPETILIIQSNERFR